jgi:hypothetical protein
MTALTVSSKRISVRIFMAACANLEIHEILELNGASRCMILGLMTIGTRNFGMLAGEYELRLRVGEIGRIFPRRLRVTV